MTKMIGIGLNNGRLLTRKEYTDWFIDGYIDHCLEYCFDQYNFTDLPTLTGIIYKARSIADHIFENNYVEV